MRQAFTKGTERLLHRPGADRQAPLDATDARVAGAYLRFALRKWRKGTPTRLMVRLSACPDFCDSPAVHELAAFLVKSGGCKVSPIRAVRNKTRAGRTGQ